MISRLLLNKGGSRPEYTVQVVGALVLLEEIVPFTRDFQPLRFCGPALLGAPGIGSPLSGHAIRASEAAAACPSSLDIRTRL